MCKFFSFFNNFFTNLHKNFSIIDNSNPIDSYKSHTKLGNSSHILIAYYLYNHFSFNNDNFVDIFDNYPINYSNMDFITDNFSYYLMTTLKIY